MVDKSKIITITTDTKLNGELLSLLFKKMQMNMSDEKSDQQEEFFAHQN